VKVCLATSKREELMRGRERLIKCAANGGASFIISRIVLLTPRRYILNYYFDNKFC